MRVTLAGDRRTRVVGWLKLVLPLAAIALLSTLFLVSERVDPDRALPFAQVDVQALAREPRVDMPRYAGMTEDGAALELTADEVRSDPMAERRLTARALVATVETPDGAVNRIYADEGVIDRSTRKLHLAGNVRLLTGTGYEVQSDALWARLDQTHLESPGPVVSEAPDARIEAGAMQLTLVPQAETPAAGGGAAADSYVLVFTGGVRMLYTPEVKR